MRRTSTVSYLLRHAGQDVEVTYKDIKHLRLRVRQADASLAVSVPLHVSEKQVVDFLVAHHDWVVRAQQRIRMTAPVVEPLVDGGRALLWGRWHEVRTRQSERRSARLVDGVLHLAGPDHEGHAKALEDLYRREARSAVEGLFAVWEPVVGRAADSLKLRRMTSRWGTCNTRSRAITINVALAERDPASLEYVVVHELTHLRERGHGARFTALMDAYLPDWRQRRRALRGAP